ncbi:restriction endonuclease subunit S [Halobacteriovorax sp. YZS-1-2]|uniref:restriction endonuclease subunit S n=1 Tax=Halobacteriovorax sp. YZS-1-2 TaxID=3391177 RepID=UPI00399A6C90
MSELNIPESWAESSIESVSIKVKQQKPTQDFNYIDIDAVDNSKNLITNPKKISADKAPSRARKPVKSGDVIFSTVRPYLKNIALVEGIENAIASTGFCVIKPVEMSSSYVFNYLRSPVFMDKIIPLQKGASYPAVSDGVVFEQLIPIPPKEEQDRIVQKIESSFEKINKTEQNLNHVEILLSKYRESLLAKAFRGELVEQVESDEPASALLDKIRAERESNQKGKKKKQEFAPITDEEKPFDIPESWEWVKLGDLLKKITDGTHHSPKNIEEGDFKYISAKNVKDWGLRLDNVTYVSSKVHDEIYSRCDPKRGDVLLIKDGATTGICCINTLDEEFSMLSSVALLRTFQFATLNEYLLFYLKSPVFQELVSDGMAGAAIKRITLKKINNMIIPLPPIEEQKRLVKKLKVLLEINHQSLASNKSKFMILMRLKESILAKAFQGELVEQITSEGSGKELLDKILALNELESSEKKVVKKASTKKRTKK